ncbi:MAG: DUF305 domain-containing protein [Beijerinckiaceae bacterium]|nr:DUF305 domain-containing protein [Beijerinckiaceae bacterium]
MNRFAAITAAAGFALAGIALPGAAAFAQHAGHDAHSGHTTAKPATTDTAATKAFRAANDKMHKDMDIAFTGDADADFARGMIPHHQGAVDMAKIVLQHGKDPEIRKLAEEVVRTQETEIKFMREWLAKRGAK